MLLDPITLAKRADARFAAKHPGVSLEQQCARLVYYLLWVAPNAPAALTAYPTAIAAARASRIERTDCVSAPAGAVVFFEIGADGHVGVSVGNGLMIHPSERAGTVLAIGRNHVKVSSIAAYPGKDLGWSYAYGANPRLSLAPWKPGVIAAAVGVVRATAAAVRAAVGWRWTIPSTAVQLRIQVALWKRRRYRGLRNGIWGPLSIAGIQRTCENVGLKKGYIPGVPGRNLCNFVQVYARRHGGFTGLETGRSRPGVLDAAAWEGFARGLEKGL